MKMRDRIERLERENAALRQRAAQLVFALGALLVRERDARAVGAAGSIVLQAEAMARQFLDECAAEGAREGGGDGR